MRDRERVSAAVLRRNPELLFTAHSSEPVAALETLELVLEEMDDMAKNPHLSKLSAYALALLRLHLKGDAA